MNLQDFSNKIDERSLRITVVGLGKMGLPIAMVFTHAGFHVTGFDISEELVEMLNQGVTTLTSEPGVKDRLRTSTDNKKFVATNNIVDAATSDVIVTIIPILDTEDGEQDLTILKNVYKELASNCHDNTLFIQESTLAPSTSKNVLWPILQEVEKKKSIFFGLVFAPERTLSGRAIQDIEVNYPKLVGGVNLVDGEIAKLLYETIAQKGVIELSDSTTAEAVKTFKGAYRDVNIAIANQFAIMADLYKVDILEVIEAANTEPYSHIHTPGIGVGGHCIPVYPKFLIHSSRSMGYRADILELSREANDFMVTYAIDQLIKTKKDIKSVLILGLAYRGGVKEFRNSPTLRLVPEYRSKNIRVCVTDPLFSKEEIDNIFGKDTGIDQKDAFTSISDFDVVIITCNHEEYRELNDVLRNKVVYDGRYIIDPKTFEGTLLQPGRIGILN